VRAERVGSDVASTYAYRVRDTDGRIIGGTLEADSQGAVASRLRQMGYAPISIEESKPGLKREISIPLLNRIKLKDIAVFSRQFATMINSGLSLLRALTILSEQTESKTLAEIVGQVRNEVEQGTALSTALAKHPKTFNRLYVAMIKAGEVGGFLDKVLLELADSIENEVELRGKVRSAMTYPIAVFAMVIMIVTAMLVFVVPQFETLYSQLGGQLPLLTRVLLTVSRVVASPWGVAVVAGIAVAVFLFRRFHATPAGRFAVDRAKLRAPVFGPLVQKTVLSRFSRTLSTLLGSGVPILQSLEIVSETVNNDVVSRAVKDVQDSVREGESLAVPLAKHTVFPPMVVQMLAVGEETGAIDVMLDKVGDFYDAEVSAAVDSLTSLIEPILIAVMGSVVGGMVVALYLPMFNIINLVK
jgi:type IV pilus assembly protein PilC